MEPAGMVPNQVWNMVFSGAGILPGPARRLVSRCAFHAVDATLRRQSTADLADGAWQRLPPFEGALPAGRGPSPVLLAFGDPVFMNRYAPALGESLARYSPHTDLHLHLFDDGGDPASPAMERLRVPGATMTRERCDMRMMGRPERARFYQCMRFVRLAQFLEASGRAYLCIDIDSLVMADLGRFDHCWAGRDVGLIIRPRFRDPGKRVLAAAVYAAPTRAGRRFMRQAGSRMLLHLFGAPFIEKLDQRSLYLTFLESGSGVRVAPLSMQLASLDPHTAAILSFRGMRKECDMREMLERYGPLEAAASQAG